MKTFRIFCLAAVTLLFVQGHAFAGDLYFYTDFDNVPAGTYQSGDLLPTNPLDDVTSGVTGIYVEVFNSDGLVVKTPDGTDGANYPSTPGPQGGQAILVDGGGKEEGLDVELSSPLPPDSFTVEIVYWSATNNIAGNTVGLQTLVSSEWPNAQYYNGVFRIYGAIIQGVGSNVPDGSEVDANTGTITAATWHTAQYVFDLNKADPANSTITVYLDGSQAGQATIDATSDPSGNTLDSGWGIFGVPVTGARAGDGSWRFTIASSPNRLINGSDNRGLQGAVDAVAISRGALTPSQFILPAGYTPPQPTKTRGGLWSLYQ